MENKFALAFGLPIGLGIGALGVGIGFGLQDVVRNFVAGMILMFERPIQPDRGRDVGVELLDRWRIRLVIVGNPKLLTGSAVRSDPPLSRTSQCRPRPWAGNPHRRSVRVTCRPVRREVPMTLPLVLCGPLLRRVAPGHGAGSLTAKASLASTSSPRTRAPA